MFFMHFFRVIIATGLRPRLYNSIFKHHVVNITQKVKNSNVYC